MKLGDKYYKITDIMNALTTTTTKNQVWLFPWVIKKLEENENGFTDITLQEVKPGSMSNRKEITAGGFGAFFVAVDDIPAITKFMSKRIELLNNNFDVLLEYFLK